MANEKTLPLIKAGILAPVVDWLESAGANVERHLDKARIPGELITSGGWIVKREIDFAVAYIHRRDEGEELVEDDDDSAIAHIIA